MEKKKAAQAGITKTFDSSRKDAGNRPATKSKKNGRAFRPSPHFSRSGKRRNSVCAMKEGANYIVRCAKIPEPTHRSRQP